MQNRPTFLEILALILAVVGVILLFTSIFIDGGDSLRLAAYIPLLVASPFLAKMSFRANRASSNMAGFGWFVSGLNYLTSILYYSGVAHVAALLYVATSFALVGLILFILAMIIIPLE